MASPPTSGYSCANPEDADPLCGLRHAITRPQRVVDLMQSSRGAAWDAFLVETAVEGRDMSMVKQLAGRRPALNFSSYSMRGPSGSIRRGPPYSRIRGTMAALEV